MSDPGTVSPSTLVCPVEQARHTLEDTYISTTQAQVVSEPDASSPVGFVDPAGHAMHALEDTYSFAVHAPAVWQLVPPYPKLHDVHVHDPVVPPTVPPLMQ